MSIVNGSIQIAHDTLANWTAWNGVLLSGQLSIVSNAASDAVRFKIGDGTTTWNSLPYYNPASSSQTLTQTLGFGNTTNGKNIILTDDDILYIGTDQTRGLAKLSAYLNPQLTIFNDNSSETISMLDAGGVQFNTISAKFSYSTASTVPYFDSNNKLVSSAVTPTELGYLSGVTSAIQTQLNAKEPTITAGTTAQYWRGDKSWQTLNTGAVTESSNLYFTNARAIASTLTGYVSGAGTVAATDTILQAIQKLNGNTAALVTGVSSVNGGTGAVTVTVTGTTNRITVTGGTGLTPTIDISSSYVGQTSITTLGTISSGTWQGTSINTSYTDAKIKGSIAVNQVAYGSAADTITGSATFLYTGTQFLIGRATAFSANSIGEFYRSSNGTVQNAVYNDNAGTSAYAQFFASNGTANIAFGVNGTGVTGGALFGTANLAYLGSANAAGTAIYASNPSGNLYFYTGGSAASNLQQTISPAGVFTLGVAGTSNQYILNVGTGTAQFIVRERIGSTTQGALYLGVSSGSESSTNYTLNFDGTLQLNTQSSTSAMALKVGDNSAFTITPANTGTISYYTFAVRARTTLTASTNVPTFEVTGNTQTWSSGTLATQYFTYLRSQTLAFSAGSTATYSSSLAVEYITVGTNATFTTSSAIYVPTKAFTSTTTAIGLDIEAPTGATNNWGIRTSGGILVNGTVNTVLANAALSTSATNGFLYMPTCAGAPSGTPTSFTGTVAHVYDTTNNKLYIYNGAWKSVTLA